MDTDIAEAQAQWRENGWYRTGQLLSDRQMDAAEEAAERYWAGERDHPLELGHLGAHLDAAQTDPDKLRLNDYATQQLDALGDAVMGREVGEVAAQLAGTTTVRLFNSSLIYKPPSPAVVGWHVDKAYWPTCSSTNMLTAWIPLHDCPEEMGPITVLEGSHRWPNTPGIARLRAGRTFLSPDPEEVERSLRDEGADFEVRTVELRRGEVSFHHCLTFHGSPPNRSDRPRKVIVLHLQDAGNMYVPAVDESGEPVRYKHDPIVRADDRGRPDYTDPAVCPVLWP